jgi:hypothetical protein
MRRIWCDPGWYPILVGLDQALAAIDPDYLVYQVKEKFGGLRYYYASGAGGAAKTEMDRLVTDAERAARHTCELTGRPGILMVRAGSWYKTLDPVDAPAGDVSFLVESTTLDDRVGAFGAEWIDGVTSGAASAVGAMDRFWSHPVAVRRSRSRPAG